MTARHLFVGLLTIALVGLITPAAVQGQDNNCENCDTVPLPEGSPTSCPSDCQTTRYVNAEQHCNPSFWDPWNNCRYGSDALYSETVSYETWDAGGEQQYECYVNGELVATFDSVAAAVAAGFTSGCSWGEASACTCSGPTITSTSNTTRCYE